MPNANPSFPQLTLIEFRLSTSRWRKKNLNKNSYKKCELNNAFFALRNFNGFFVTYCSSLRSSLRRSASLCYSFFSDSFSFIFQNIALLRSASLIVLCLFSYHQAIIIAFSIQKELSSLKSGNFTASFQFRKNKKKQKLKEKNQ